MSKRRAREHRRKVALRRPRPEAAITPVPAGRTKSPHRDDTLIPGRIQPEPRIARGPGKRRGTGVPVPRLNSHKARSIWFRARAAWPMREAPVTTVVRERDLSRKRLTPAPGTSQWEGIGPTNIGGRLTCAVCDPAHPDHVWVGAAGGGVWFSPDTGQTWRSLWHDQDVLNVGALAIDPSNPNILYCGTGEANLSADSYGGVGLYRTIDGGVTWQLHAASEKTGVPRRIGCIAIDPFDPKHLLIAGVGFNEVAAGRELGGLYESHDGGVTWTRLPLGNAGNYWSHSVRFHPTQSGIVFATITARGATSGIYRSSDGGVRWTHLRSGLPPPERMGRASLAISPSNPDVLYAICADAHSDSADAMLGVFRSSNGGARWTNVTRRHFRTEGQMSYGNTIAVHPDNPNHVICGGVDLHLSRNGGRTWTRVTTWNARRGTQRYAHADHHGLLMPAGIPGRVYDPNDGGLDVSDDGGLTWKNRSNGLAVTMYYDMDVAQSDPRAFGGGAQDNGTLVTTSGRADDHMEILGGDGGWIVFDRRNASRLFASYYNLNIFRFRNNRAVDVSPPATKEERDATWMAFIAAATENPDVVFTGSSRVWRSRDDGTTWHSVSSTLDGSSISAIEIAVADDQRVYVATENGGFFRSLDGGATWSANLAGSLPGHIITRIATAPNQANRVFVTLGNFGHGHVFRSDNGGMTWTDVDRQQLPDVPHHAIVIPEDDPRTMYVCSDAGVHVSTDAGETWMDLLRNLPHVMMVDLVYHEPTSTLYAASYGRSLFRLAGPLT
ncbi:MAG TPA: hypothetical protein VKE51_26925 [Vicinamibacterales bacterium]|nr:hypothetical protein [Vicinamibacterales bacterium]